MRRLTLRTVFALVFVQIVFVTVLFSMSDTSHDFSRRALLTVLVSAVFVSSAAAAEVRVNYARRDEVRFWAAELSQTENIPFDWIIRQMTRARYSAVSEKIMSTPALTAGKTPRNWLRHRENFINDTRINAAELFISHNRNKLTQTERDYGVPADIITSIIGVETVFGRAAGNFKTLDCLATLSFDYTRRSDFFRQELASFLIWCRKHNIDPTSVKGSFAGAVGMCQFMPSNILKFGVDADGDGIVELRKSAADTIESVANYLAKNGWVKGLPGSWPCQADDKIAAELASGGTTANTTLQNALDAGVELTEPIDLAPDERVLLVRLACPEDIVPGGAIWRLGSRNFETLLHYNRAYFYAQTVLDLAQAIKPFFESDAAVW